MGVLLIATLCASTAEAEPGDPMTDPVAFCVEAEPDFRKRRTCEVDWVKAAEKVVAFGRMQGLIDTDGDMNVVALIKRSIGWRALIGLPPDDPYLYCMGQERFLGPYDFRKIWDCIVARDPEAARMDSI